LVDIERPVVALGSEIRKHMDGPIDVPVLKRAPGNSKIVLCDRSGVSGKDFLFLATNHGAGLTPGFIPDIESG